MIRQNAEGARILGSPLTSKMVGPVLAGLGGERVEHNFCLLNSILCQFMCIGGACQNLPFLNCVYILSFFRNMQRLLRTPKLLVSSGKLTRPYLAPASLLLTKTCQANQRTLEPRRSLSLTSHVKTSSSSPKELRDAWGSPGFDVKEMKTLLDHDNHEMRDSCRSYMSGELFKPKYNISIDEERDLALKRLQALCDNNFISVLDFKNNPLRIFAAHELAVIVDPAMTTKMTVQFNLFGGTVLKLGTERHHEKLLAGKNCAFQVILQS